METMCPPSYHDNDFAAIHALENMMVGHIASIIAS